MKAAATVRTVPISTLVLDDHNANKGTKRGRALLEQSLKKYGAGRSVLIDKNNRVIAGNKTVEQARANGMKSIQVIETDGSSLVAVQRGDLDLKKHRAAKELAIADNRVSELDLEWNPEVLAGLEVDLSAFWNEGEMRKVLGDFAPPLPEAPEPKLDKAAELQRKYGTKRGQIWDIWHASKRQAELEAAMIKHDLFVHQQIIWKKSRQVLTYSHFMWGHEPCFYGWLKGHQPERRPPANQPSVWEIGTAGNEDAAHPTQKPIAIFAWPLSWHIGPGEIAVEPFSGSGTQLCAAQATDRICYAMEIEPKYVAVALERLAEMGLEPKLVKHA